MEILAYINPHEILWSHKHRTWIFSWHTSTLRFIPVSLMPDINELQIAVQAKMPSCSAIETDKGMVSKLRGQQMQVAREKDISSEAGIDAYYMMMTFKSGSDIALSFIEMNEEIDQAMNTMPNNIEHPKVSAMDILHSI